MDGVTRLRILVYAIGGALLGAGVAIAVFMPELVADAAKNPQYTSPIMLLPFFAGGGGVVGAIGAVFVALVVGGADRILSHRWWWARALVRVAAVGVVAICTYAFVASSSDATIEAASYLITTTAIGAGGVIALDWVFLRTDRSRRRRESQH